MMMVFILLGRYKKTTMGNNHLPLAVLGVGMSKIRARLDLVSGEVLLLVVFRLRGGRGRLRPGLSLLERAAISFTQALIQGAPPPIPAPCRQHFPAGILGGDTFGP